jgi:UDP-arabinose 4-epimerase
MGRRVIVTGGAGYIGSHICKSLASAGIQPIVYDNLATGHRHSIRWGAFIEGDIQDCARITQALCDFEPEAVIHCAGSAYVEESLADPLKYYRNNVIGALSLLEACGRSGINKIVFSSSCAVYGIPAQLPVSEASPLCPISPYGQSKLMVEQLLRDCGEVHGIRYVALRFFNAAGADLDGELSERHYPETHLIPRALLAASGQLPCLTVYGDDHDTMDGSCLRDYVHVTDLADVHIKAIDYLREGNANLTANLGSGQPTSVFEIIQAVESITGRPVPFVIQPRRSGDPSALYADCSHAREKLGFSAPRSDISTIVHTAAPTFGHAVSGAPVDAGARSYTCNTARSAVAAR